MSNIGSMVPRWDLERLAEEAHFQMQLHTAKEALVVFVSSEAFQKSYGELSPHGITLAGLLVAIDPYLPGFSCYCRVAR